MTVTDGASRDSVGADVALLELLRLLGERRYRFVTPTPATHARVVARPDRKMARTLEDVLGWSLPFDRALLLPDIVDCLRTAGALREDVDGLRSLVRVSSLGETLFVHSAFPTTDADAVFFGPDSYRFAAAIQRELERRPAMPGERIVDIGTGAGVGAIVAAQAIPGAVVTMTDINPQALRLARINAEAAGIAAEGIQTYGMDRVPAVIDLVTINPPFIIDAGMRTYRHGGDMHGGQLSLDLATAAIDHLAPGGRVILYTGSAIVHGTDPLKQALARAAAMHRCNMAYDELDPDVFGEELDGAPYADVDRIALVVAILTSGA